MHRYNPRRRRDKEWDYFTESDTGDMEDLLKLDPNSAPYNPDEVFGTGRKEKSYMVLHTKPGFSGENSANESSHVMIGDRETSPISYSSIWNYIGDSESLVQKCGLFLFENFSSSQGLTFFILLLLASFFFYPWTSTIVIGGLFAIIIAGNQREDKKSSTRTARWTVTSFSHQMKDGFLASPPFLDKCGQWRMVIKQKKGIDGLQTTFGLLCTDIFQEVENVSATVTFFCTNQLGHEVNTGGMRNLKFQQEFIVPGDCGFSRPIHISRRQLGDSETIIVHCTVEFSMITFTLVKMIMASIRNELGVGGSDRRNHKRKGKNVVTEHGSVNPGDLEFHDEMSLPQVFRPIMRFVRNPDTRTFVWEIPGFTTLLENSEVWGIYSPQFFVNSRDVCSIWRMKLLEVQGVFRLHVQLRGLPGTVRQVKMWYLLQLVDIHGDSVIPEHAVARVKYPDHMNLWDTTRHILYRRETILARFIGTSGQLCLRISLQMEPNDVSLMEVDSDEWIQNPNVDANINNALDGPRGLPNEFSQTTSKMLGN